jgi:hypothetical protein
MFYKDNWMTWYYDGVERGPKTSPESVWSLDFKKTISRPIKSYKEELLLNAQALRDQFTEPFDLLLSGGVDSEVILRCYHELKIPVNVFIFQYENNINRQECIRALNLCNELNVTPTVIDFNLEKFFENDAYDIWKTGYFASAGRLIYLKFLEYLDNIPVLGDGDLECFYENDNWYFQLRELEYAVTVYATAIGKKVIADWYHYSPEVIISHMNTPIVNKMLNNAVPILNYSEVKYFCYKSIWPQIEIRKKQSGWEIDSINSIPPYMEKFNRTYTNNMEFKKYSFTRKEFTELLTTR